MSSRAGVPTPSGPRWRRWFFAALVAGTTAGGVATMYGIMSFDGLAILEVTILVLFTVTFGWIAISFWTGVTGFLLQAFGRSPLSLMPTNPSGSNGPAEETGLPSLRSRTALVMPVFHEDPERVLAGVRSIVESLEATGEEARFAFHLLSDSTDPHRIREEEVAWHGFRSRYRGAVELHYRRRESNEGRKAGNIMEFCDRLGERYEFMVVLDADSVMGGETLVRMVGLMEETPRAGLIQTVPIPCGQETLFGRILQFGASLYGPMHAAGQSFWQGETANYWGHNAIVRLHPFREHCRLPPLPGRPPLGGEILSHDFVEAAFLRRGGWEVYLLPELGESYEEVPGNVLSYAKRDRRWAQGSLQHLRLLLAPGLHPVNRIHFLLGAMGYVSSLLWFLLLIAGTAYVLLPHPLGGVVVTLPALGEGGGLERAGPFASLLLVTAVLLFGPKGLGVTLAWFRRPRDFGGRIRLVASAFLEALFAVIVAPILMLFHSAFVMGIAVGRDVAWDPQEREGRTLPWREAWRSTLPITGVGIAWSGVTLAVSAGFFLWLSPIVVGLVVAAPLVWWTSAPEVGRRARAWGLFLTPAETRSGGKGRGSPVPVGVVTDREAPLPVPSPLSAAPDSDIG